METYIFYCYLKYKKKNNSTLRTMLKKVPTKIIVMIITTFLCAVLGLICSFFVRWPWLFWVFAIAECSLGFRAFILVEKWEVNISDKELDNFKSSSRELYEWLSKMSISSKENIEILINRFKNTVLEQKNQHRQQSDKIDKWMQTLIIPLIIAIITALIANQVEINKIVIYTVYLLAVAGMVYGLIWLIRSIIAAIKNIRRSDMENFIEDLQGVIDVMFVFKDNSEDACSNQIID